MINRGEAAYIFKNINSELYTDEHKGAAIHNVMNWVTHNSITKADMLDVIRYMWNLCFEMKEDEP